ILDSVAITHSCANRGSMLQYPYYIDANTHHESRTGEVAMEHFVSELQTSYISIEARHSGNRGVLLCTLISLK
ncbi:hypothetical protein PHMEG_00012081, partial [Phytophthora megakarya]